MTTRFTGLIPAMALLAVGAAIALPVPAMAQNQTGSMAFPESNPSGQVRIQSPTSRDTGSMAFPASPGGVTEAAPTGADTGNMAVPTGRGSLNRRRVAATPVAMRGDPANSMRPDVAPTPAQTATARSLDSAPSAAPVPYTDFLPPERAGRGAMAMHHNAMMHGHAAMAHHHAAMAHHHAAMMHHAAAHHAATTDAAPTAAPAPAAAPAATAPAK